MDIYCLYTDSHEDLFENWFKKTLPNELNLKSVKKDQHCKTAKYRESGWEQTTKEKIELAIKACEDNFGDFFIFSDVDVQFFDNVKDDLLKEIDGYDIAFQKGKEAYCSGFFICKSNKKTLEFFKKSLEEHHKYKGEQSTYNDVLKKINNLKVKSLPKKYYTIGFDFDKIPWKSGINLNFELPPNIKIHHATCTIGNKNKKELLKKMRNKLV